MNVKQIPFIAAFALLALSTATGCSLEKPERGSGFKIFLHDIESSLEQTRLYESLTTLANPFTPTSIGDFSCFSVNVTGDGLALNNQLGDCSDSTNFRGKGAGVLARAVSRGGVIEVDLPAGRNRTIDVLGLYPPTAPCTDAGTSGHTGSFGYFLGSALTDVSENHSVNIGISYSGQSGTLSCNGAAPVTRTYVYAVNQTSNDISLWKLDPATGLLSSISVAIAAGTRPYGLTVTPNGKFLYTGNYNSNNVSGFIIEKTNGALISIGAPTAAGTNPSGVMATPNGLFLYAANNGGNVSGYSINSTTGVLTATPGSPYTAGTNTQAIAIDTSGQFLYAVNNGSSNITRFTINQTTGALTFVGNFAVGITPSFASISSNNLLFVTNTGSGTMGVYSINPSTGALTAITGSPFAVGTADYYLAIDPAGKFAYVSNSSSNSVSGFMFNSASTTYTAASGSPFTGITGPQGLCVDPSGRFLFVSNGAVMKSYSINAANGAITSLESSIAAGTAPVTCTVATITQ